MKAANVPELEIVALVRSIESKYHRWTLLSEVEALLLPKFPGKVVMAKLRSMVRRGVLTGCACGCYGGFEIGAVRPRQTPEAIEASGSTNSQPMNTATSGLHADRNRPASGSPAERRRARET